MDELPEKPPPIPEIKDEELYQAVSALANAGELFMESFKEVFSGKSVHKVMLEKLYQLTIAEKVIVAWLEKFSSDGKTKWN